MSDALARIAELAPGRRAELRARLWDRGLAGAAVGWVEDGDPPASFTQRRLVFLDQLAPGSLAYVTPIRLTLLGRIEVGALAAAFDELLARHDALRCRLPVIEGVPVQQAGPAAGGSLTVVDLSGLGLEAGRAEAARLAAAEGGRPFDLAAGPLYRFALIRPAADEAVLCLTFHHAVVDGWSIAVLTEELGELYHAHLRGRPAALRDLPIGFAEYARWQADWLAGPDAERQLEYWVAQLAGAPQRTDLPYDRPRPVEPGTVGATYAFSVSRQTVAELEELATRTGCTLYMVLLAAFQAVLSRYGAGADVLVGTPIANRLRPEFERIVGFFANSLILRGRPRAQAPFREFLAEVRATCLDAFAHQDVPLDVIAQRLHPDREIGRNPLYQVSFVLQNAPQPLSEVSGLRIEPVTGPGWAPEEGARFDLDLAAWPTEDGLECLFTYATELFDARTAARIGRSWARVLESVAADPGIRLGDLPVLAPSEWHELVVGFNEQADTCTDPDAADAAGRPELIHRLVADRVALDPQAVAIVAADGEETTFAQLDRRANALAQQLHADGVGPGSLVGVLCERTPALLGALLAVLKAGAAFVPLDPVYPRARLGHMLSDSGVEHVLTDRRSAGRADLSGYRTTVLDTDLPSESAQAPDVALTGDDPAYVMYTSGSTGGPKGVMLGHRNVVNYLRWAVEAYQAGRGSGVPVHSSPAFDLTITSLFAPLLAGRPVVLLADSDVPGQALHDHLRTARDAAFVKLTPGHLGLLDPAAIRDGVTRALVIGGAALHAEHVAAWRREAPHTRLINEYGPTEIAVACTAYEIGPEDRPTGPVPIGRPIANTRVYVLDDAMRPVPAGVAGELYVGGAGVAHGYLGRPGPTAERFVPDPFSAHGGRLYRTGDRVRLRGDRQLEYLGRTDDQVKVRGHRVESGEVAAVVAAAAAVRDCAVEAIATADGEHELVAFVVADPGSAAEIRADDEPIHEWRELYDDMYGSAGAPDDPFFDLAGWTDSYTGTPIDPAEMKQWLDGIVGRIRAERLGRVLELGCGTGLILARVAPHADSYVGVDLSAQVVRRLEARLRPDGPAAAWAGRVELRVGHADGGIRPGEQYDTIIVNSVAQYFPSGEYLMGVLDQAVSALAPGGRLILGDLRNLALRRLFHTSVQLAQATVASPVGEVRAQIERRLDADRELHVDPRFFAAARTRWPHISDIEVLVKGGEYRNELSCFRYDVVIRRGEAAGRSDSDISTLSEVEAGAVLDPSCDPSGLPPAFVLRAVPNGRLTAEVRRESALREAFATSGEIPLGAALATMSQTADGVDPEALQATARRFGYEIELSWAGGAADGSFDAVCWKIGAVPPLPASSGPTSPADDAWRHYVNDPHWTARTGAASVGIADAVSRSLPEAMRPARVVFVRELPLNANGKVDRGLLRRTYRAHGPRRTADGVGRPLGATEQQVAAIWSELLNVRTVRADDDFFDLGGHSLLTFQLVFRLRRAFDVDVPVRTPFDRPVLADLAAELDLLVAQNASRLPELAPVPRNGLIAASPAQGRLWFLHQLDPDGTEYNVPLYQRLTGPLDVAALRDALTAVVARHEILRTTLVTVDGAPFQSIGRPSSFELGFVDLSGLADAEACAAHLAAVDFARPFRLGVRPVLRATLLRLGEQNHVLLLCVHHIVTDGWSNATLLGEIAACYGAYAGGSEPQLAPLRVQYADFAAWQNALLTTGEYAETLTAYWKSRVRDIARLPRLAPDLPAPPERSGRGERIAFEIRGESAELLRALCRAEKVTPFMALAAAMFGLLHERTGGEDLAIGTDVAGRSDTSTEGLLGFFVNQVVLRVDLSGRPTWRELLHRVRAVAVEAYAHQDLPFERVVRLAGVRPSAEDQGLFQLKLVFDNTQQAQGTLAGGIEVEAFDTGFETVRPGLTVLVSEDGAGFAGTWEYPTDRFSPELIAGFVERFVRLVEHSLRHQDLAIGAAAPTAAAAATAKRGLGIRSVRPERISVAAAESGVVRRRPAEGPALPVVYEADGPAPDLTTWAKAHVDQIDAALSTAGAVLFRHFGIDTPERLEAVASALVDDLFRENGEHPRALGDGRVYEPTFFPAERKLLWHHENAFNDRGPSRILFACAVPAAAGGETPLADGREVYRRLPADLREEFIRRGVRYGRVYTGGLGLPWQKVFRTDERAVVEARCARAGIEFSWRGDTLVTSAARPAVLRHPLTGEPSWFNQLPHWHPAALDGADRAALAAAVGPEGPPRSFTFADGGAVPDDAVAAILRVYERAEAVFAWQSGDVLVLDNILIAHARNPFTGPRQLYVAMGAMVDFR